MENLARNAAGQRPHIGDISCPHSAQDEFDELVAKESSLKERRATVTQAIATLEAGLKQHIASLPEDFEEAEAQQRKRQGFQSHRYFLHS